MKLRDLFYALWQQIVGLWKYPSLQAESNYNNYWHVRKLNTFSMNSFQQQRAQFVADAVDMGSSILDVGCGNGAVLKYIHEQKALKERLGVDLSEDALELARANGVRTFKTDILTEERQQLPVVDYILLFEVLEHLERPEDVLLWACTHARKGVFISVPNTGYLFHRLRLVLGRFPLQWRAHPSEHIRFWTWHDMRWWLKALDISQYDLCGYEGIPLLRSLMPSLFAQGLFVIIRKE